MKRYEILSIQLNNFVFLDDSQKADLVDYMAGGRINITMEVNKSDL